MKTLTAKQMEKKGELIDDLRLQKVSITDKLSSVNGVIAVLNEKIEAYNTILQQVNDFRNEVAEAIEADWSDKEEEWFTSNEGEEQTGWKEDWEQSFPDSIETVSEVELEVLDHDKDLENLAETP